MTRIIVAFAGTAILCCLDIARTRPVAANFQSHNQKEIPQSCPVTKPPQPPFVPPAPYPSDHQVWIGSAKLWTNIAKDGIWRGSSQKVFWWSEGYDWRIENPPKLKITGKRLDEPAPRLSTDRANAGWTNDKDHAFMVDAFVVPTSGCWKISGHYKDRELSYVVWVAK